MYKKRFKNSAHAIDQKKYPPGFMRLKEPAVGGSGWAAYCINFYTKCI